VKLEGKVAVITGGSKGIGLGCARVFAKYGCTVVLAARGTLFETVISHPPWTLPSFAAMLWKRMFEYCVFRETVLLGMALWICSAIDRGILVSASPCQMVTGIKISWSGNPQEWAKIIPSRVKPPTPWRTPSSQLGISMALISGWRKMI